MSLIDDLNQASPDELAQIGSLLAPYTYDRTKVRKDAKDTVAVRVLQSGSAVANDAAGKQRDISGHSLFDTVNFNGASVTINADNPRQADVAVGDVCLADYYVGADITPSATSFTTIQAAINAAIANSPTTGFAPFTPSGTITIHICPGVYNEDISFPDLGIGGGYTILLDGPPSEFLWEFPTVNVGTFASTPALTIAKQSGIGSFNFRNIDFFADSDNVACQLNGGSVGFTSCLIGGDMVMNGGGTGTGGLSQLDLDRVNFGGFGGLIDDTASGQFSTNVAVHMRRTYLDYISLQGTGNPGGAGQPTRIDVRECVFQSMPAIICNRPAGFNDYDLTIDGNRMQTDITTKTSWITIKADVALANGEPKALMIHNNEFGYHTSSATSQHFDCIVINCTTGTLYNLSIVGNAFGSAYTGTIAHTHMVSIQGAGTVDGAVIVGNDWNNVNASGSDFQGVVVESSGTLTNSVIAANAPSGAANTLGSGTGNNTGAPSSSPYVTIGNDANLSAERALTAGNGVGFVDGGANSTATLGLVDLTGNWTQAGVFDISTAGNLTVLKHAAIGPAQTVDTTTTLTVGETATDPAGGVQAIKGTFIASLTADNTQTVTGLNYVAAGAGAHTLSGILAAAKLTTQTLSGVTVSDARDLYLLASVGSGTVITTRYGIYVANATGSGTVTNQYGLYIENMAKGGTLNRAIHSVGGVSDHLGAMTFGANQAPDASALLDLVSTTQGLAPPRMTTTQRDAISSPLKGLLIFNNTTDEYEFYTGSAWAAVAGSGGASGGTPALTLSTANSAGSATTFIRTDDTILAFDATAPVTQAMGDSAAVGAATVTARRDHKHGMPALGTTAAAIGTSAGGSAVTPSKSDHVHATGAGTPSTQAFGDAASTGTGPAAAMTDHKHGMMASPTNALLDGTAHTDTLAGTVARGDVIVGNSTPKWARLAVGSANKVLHSDGTDATWQSLVTADLPTNAKTRDIVITIDGGGSTITTGYKGFYHLDFGGTINQVTILGDTGSAGGTGSVVVDLWKCTYSQYDARSTHPVSGDSITASAKPTISSAAKAQDATLTGWTTTISAGDVLAWNVNSITSFQVVTLSLKVTVT